MAKLRRSLLIKDLKQVEDISLLHAIKAVAYYGLKKKPYQPRTI